MSQIYTISNKIADIKLLPNKRSELISQGLFGENLIVKRKKSSWTECILLRDQYVGWIENKDLMKRLEHNYKVISIKTIIKKKPDIKSETISHLSIGSLVMVLHFSGEWAKLKLNHNNKVGYVPMKHISHINYFNGTIVDHASKMIGTPYLWGGKSSFGIDCSALVQLAFQIYGFNFPRDTVDQIKIAESNFVTTDNLSKDCILFWNGHVALAKSKNYLIHASAQKMSVVCEYSPSAIRYIEKVTNSNTRIFKIIKSSLKNN